MSNKSKQANNLFFLQKMSYMNVMNGLILFYFLKNVTKLKLKQMDKLFFSKCIGC